MKIVNLIGNVIWFVLTGWILGLEFLIGGLLCCLGHGDWRGDVLFLTVDDHCGSLLCLSWHMLPALQMSVSGESDIRRFIFGLSMSDSAESDTHGIYFSPRMSVSGESDT